MNAFILYIALSFAFTISSSTLCNGLVRKLDSETDPVVLTCWKTTDFDFCVITLRSDHRSAGATVNGLAHIALDKLEYYAKDTSNYLQDLDKQCSAQEKVVTRACINYYDVAVNTDVPSAVKSFNVKDYADAKKGVLATMNDARKCKGVIDKKLVTKWWLLSRRNQYVYNVSLLSNDLIQLLW